MAMKRGTKGKNIRIGGAGGYWGDSAQAPRQLVLGGDIDYLVFDYLAEVTMSILVRAKQKDPAAGYAGDFITGVMKPLLSQIKERGIKVIANAGGVNVKACAQALATLAREAGIDIKIGTVCGDDLLGQMDELRKEPICEMFSGARLPENLSSANAYLGAFPIACALDEGADIVITGRCVDSAVTLGPLIHEFGWKAEDFDLLAAGTLAGHIIECGAQASGGNFTDWRDVADGWDNMGYPIAEVASDGIIVISKPDNTGGLISRLSVGEQILYEIGDPENYIMADVVCDFSQISLQQTGENQVRISGAIGKAPTSTYKVSATYQDGYRANATTLISGFDAVEKGQYFGDALIKRTRRLFQRHHMVDYHDYAIHLVGASARPDEIVFENAPNPGEIVVEICVRHMDLKALELFSKETTGVALSMATGRGSIGNTGRPKVSPVIAQFAFLVDKSKIRQCVKLDGVNVHFSAKKVTYSSASSSSHDVFPQEANGWKDEADLFEIQLIDIAVARSGDKGNNANIGVMARDLELAQTLNLALKRKQVEKWFSAQLKGEVLRYELPGFGALNFVLVNCLGGGGTSSVHLDVLAKTYAQQLLAMPIFVPRHIAQTLVKA